MQCISEKTYNLISLQQHKMFQIQRQSTMESILKTSSPTFKPSYKRRKHCPPIIVGTMQLSKCRCCPPYISSVATLKAPPKIMSEGAVYQSILKVDICCLKAYNSSLHTLLLVSVMLDLAAVVARSTWIRILKQINLKSTGYQTKPYVRCCPSSNQIHSMVFCLPVPARTALSPTFLINKSVNDITTKKRHRPRLP
jgi:hypothetical protein